MWEILNSVLNIFVLFNYILKLFFWNEKKNFIFLPTNHSKCPKSLRFTARQSNKRTKNKVRTSHWDCSHTWRGISKAASSAGRLIVGGGGVLCGVCVAFVSIMLCTCFLDSFFFIFYSLQGVAYFQGMGMYPIVQFPARSLTWDAFDRIVGWYFRRIFRGQQTHSIRTKALENGNAGRVEFSKVGIIKRLICEFFWGHNNTIEWQNQPSLKDLAEVIVNKGEVGICYSRSPHTRVTRTHGGHLFAWWWQTMFCTLKHGGSFQVLCLHIGFDDDGDDARRGNVLNIQ